MVQPSARVMDLYPGLGQLADPLLADFFHEPRRMTVAEGAHLQLENSPCDMLAFVLSGSKRIYKLSDQGKEITLYEVEPGGLCSLMGLSVLSTKPYLANAVALTPMEILGVPAPRVRELTARHDPLRLFLFQHIHEEIASLMTLLSEVAFDRTGDRLKRYLARKACAGTVHLTHQQIAADLGTLREVVSRLLKDLERRGQLRLYRGTIQLTELFFESLGAS